jgi:pimeloyl-ACP methyl ester carboxylesterase
VPRLSLLALLLALVATPAAQAARLSPCKHQAAFGCGTIRVPLDQSGRVPGTIGLKIAVERKVPASRPVLVALSGGPGQSSVSAASSFALSLAPALKRYRLAVFDQRGTGGSGALNCPVLQREDGLAPVVPQELADCAQLIGPRRAFFSTVDSVHDIDALRRYLNVDKIALMGVSYGTFVAQQYARLYPEHTDRLILDSVVGARGIDAYLLDTYQRMPRVLREQCARKACSGITSDPVADVAALAAKLQVGGLSGPAYTATGRRRTVRLGTPDDLANVLMGADLNPYVQPALPAAIHAALEGDPAMLLRLRRDSAGPPTKLADLSAGLNVATNCQDTRLPYALSSPFEDRPALVEQGLAGYSDEALYPFPRATVLSNSVASDCLRWPGDEGASPPSAAPLPDVPALILDGRLDLRTPLENGRELAKELPHARIVTVAGTGHDELDSDVTGCVAVALKRFVDRARVGDPCKGLTNAVAPFPIAPHALSAFRLPRGTAGARGRVVAAVLVSAVDARVAVLQDLYAGFAELQGGGLRGGSYRLQGSSKLKLRGYSYLASVRVTGTLELGGDHPTGKLKVNGPGSLDGTLRLDGKGGAVGTIGGRHVRARGVKSGSASAAGVRGAAGFPSAARLARAERHARWIAPRLRAVR